MVVFLKKIQKQPIFLSLRYIYALIILSTRSYSLTLYKVKKIDFLYLSFFPNNYENIRHPYNYRSFLVIISIIHTFKNKKFSEK